MDQTSLVEDFVLPEVELKDIENYDLIPMVRQWLVCSDMGACRAAEQGLPVVKTHAGNWYGVLQA